MKIKQQDGPPSDLLYFDNEMNLTNDHVEDIVEIFNTPLTGAYNWDYTVADNRIKKLYELGKQLNWNGSIDLNWDYTCLLYTSPSPRDGLLSRMPSSA